MKRLHRLAAVAFVASLLPLAARGQSPYPMPAQLVAPPAPPDYNPPPRLPHPADQPTSLYKTALGAPIYTGADLESPYFQPDPLLDCPETCQFCSSQPGWLFDVELDYLGSHVINHVGQFAQPLSIPVPFTVSVPMAKLDWAASPRFEAGYRLPSGFGELDFAYRFLSASGSGTTDDPAAAPDAPAAVLSHLHFSVADLDYANRETSLATMLGAGFGMKWRLGLRTADTTFDSRADEPFAAASGGSGFYERAISNHFWGIGPHAGLELRRSWESTGLGIVFRSDGGLLFGKTTQRFNELSTTAGGNGQYEFDNLQQVPMLGGYLGLDWQPPHHPGVDLQLGYTGEYWWNVGRLSDPDLYAGQTAGEFGTSGFVLRLECNY